MPVISRVIKPSTHRGKKALQKKEPKLIEDAKQTLLIKGGHTSQIVVDYLKDLYHLKKPDVQMMQKKNDILPFEDITPIEKFCTKLNASLFMFISHNKKRPNNFIIGRTHEHILLDMVEFGIENYKGLKEFKVSKVTEGIKPLLVFNGELFETNNTFSGTRNLLVDMFQRESAKNIRLQGLEHVLSFTAVESKILMRSYRVLLKKSNTRIPRIELEEIGPRADLIFRRTKFASEDHFKQACKKPKELKVIKKKNITKDTLGTTFGRIHVGTQNIQSLQTRKMKGLKKTLAERKSEQRKRKNPEDGTEAAKKLKSTESSTD